MKESMSQVYDQGLIVSVQLGPDCDLKEEREILESVNFSDEILFSKNLPLPKQILNLLNKYGEEENVRYNMTIDAFKAKLIKENLELELFRKKLKLKKIELSSPLIRCETALSELGEAERYNFNGRLVFAVDSRTQSLAGFGVDLFTQANILTQDFVGESISGEYRGVVARELDERRQRVRIRENQIKKR